MTNTKQLLEDFREAFVYKGHGIWHKKVDGYEDENDNFIAKPHEAYAVPEFMEQWLATAFQTIEEETANDICKITDDIELSMRDTSMEEWKMFKRIRNTIRDKYVLKEPKP